MSIEAYYLTPDGKLNRSLSKEDIKAAFESKEGLLWVDITGTREDDGRFLEEIFHFHHLAAEDCTSPLIHPPKIDEFGDHLFIIVHGINYAVISEIVETAELAIFLGAHFMVSNHNSPLYSVDAVRQKVEDDGRPMKRGADFLCHALIDTLIDNILPTIDKMSDIAQDIEEETLREPKQATLEAILNLKRSTLRVHRVMVPQREIFNRLSRGDYQVIREEAKIFYRDVYDHLVRIEDLNQIIRDRVDNALATYLSSVANRQNEVMKTLAIVATIFLPLTLLAGIYGMNFENMPELKWEWGYFIVLGIIFSTILLCLWRFRSSGWIAWGRRRVKSVVSFRVEPEKLIGFIGHTVKRTFVQK